MSADIRPIPDLKAVASDWLVETFPTQLGDRPDGTLLVRQETPVELRALLAEHELFVRVGAIPGRTTLHQVTAGVDFDVFALTDKKAGDFARLIEARFLRGRHRTASGASLDTVVSTLSPETVPWADTGVRRYYTSFGVTARR